MNGNIYNGIVLSIENNAAKVAPIDNINLISQNIKIADYLDAAQIQKGTRVAYIQFNDDTGIIIAKL